MSKKAPQQLSLDLALRDDATFANFYLPVAGKNQLLVHTLKTAHATANNAAVYLWGVAGSGISHLLQACCHHASEQGLLAQYLPLSLLQQYPPEQLCDGLASLDLVCFDDVEAVLHARDWNEALFNAFNQLRDANKRMVFAAQVNTAELSCNLEDLRSRLSSCLNFHVESLNDSDKASALRERANARGLQMNEEVAKFILAHCPRDTAHLFLLLDELDQASLREQRRLTIPFVKSVLRLGSL